MRSNHLIDVFDDVLIDGGIFKALSLLEVPWKDDIDDTALDLEYYGNISGQKFVSPLLCRILGDNDKLTSANITTLANVLFAMFGKNWTELYATLSYEYNPISNYDMVETETSSGTTSDTLTHTGTQNTTHTGTVGMSDTTTHTGTQNTTHTGTVGTSDNQTVNGSGTGSTENDVWGFNSSSAIEDNLSETETTNTNTATGSSTQTNNLTDARTDNLTDTVSSTQTNNLTDARTDNLTDTGSGTHSDTRTLTRSGNIGVTTSQMMIQSQRDLWLWNFIYNVVFPDVDKVLTISTYSNR